MSRLKQRAGRRAVLRVLARFGSWESWRARDPPGDAESHEERARGIRQQRERVKEHDSGIEVCSRRPHTRETEIVRGTHRGLKCWRPTPDADR